MSQVTVVFYFEDGAIIGSTVCHQSIAHLQTNPAAFGTIIVPEYAGNLTDYCVEDGRLVSRLVTEPGPLPA